MIFIPDKIAALYKIDVNHCRYRERDEINRGTWVYDRLMGLTRGDLGNRLKSNVVLEYAYPCND